MNIELDGIPLVKADQSPQGGQTEIRNVFNISTTDKRDMVGHKIPGMEGDVFQNLGRSPVVISFDGTFQGQGAKENIEVLRTKFKQGTPLPFNSDISGAADITHVLINDMRIEESSRVLGRYHYFMVLQEYKVPPPEPATPASQDGEAAEWQEDAAQEAIATVNLITGKVLDSEGNPKSGVTVKVTGGSGEYSTETNEEGIYRLDEVPPGDYVVTVDLEEYQGIEEHVRVVRAEGGEESGEEPAGGEGEGESSTAAGETGAAEGGGETAEGGEEGRQETGAGGEEQAAAESGTESEKEPSGESGSTDTGETGPKDGEKESVTGKSDQDQAEVKDEDKGKGKDSDSAKTQDTGQKDQEKEQVTSSGKAGQDQTGARDEDKRKGKDSDSAKTQDTGQKDQEKEQVTSSGRAGQDQTGARDEDKRKGKDSDSAETQDTGQKDQEKEQVTSSGKAGQEEQEKTQATSSGKAEQEEQEKTQATSSGKAGQDQTGARDEDKGKGKGRGKTKSSRGKK